MSNPNPFAANIPKYFVYQALKGFGFGLFVATWLIYMIQARGLSLSQAALLDVTFFVVATFGEIPTGIVADSLGRKTSMIAGSILLSMGILVWAFAPFLWLVVVGYICLGIGFNFLSGAEDALFYESVQIAGRGNEYTRLIGRAGAMFPGTLAVGSLFGGILAAIDLQLPYYVSGLVLFAMLGVVLTLKEPHNHQMTEEELKTRKPFRQVVRQAFALIRQDATLRYLMIYIALAPMASFMLESLFLQPQALALGIPLAGVGALFMAIQIVNMAGLAWADRLKTRFGEKRLLYTAPVITVTCVLLLAMFQVIPSLIFIAVMGFLTAALRPIVLNRIQSEVPDDIRATVISMQSMMFTVIGAFTQASITQVADRTSLPTAYVVLASVFGVLMLALLWVSRRHMPYPEIALPATVQVDFV